MSKEITVVEATHANQLGYTDVNPYEIMDKRTPRKIMVRAMDAVIDPNWKMNVSIGGFVGHCNNNRTQEYSYSSNENYPEVAVRLNKHGIWKDKYGNRYSLNVYPYKFYDFNF